MAYKILALGNYGNSAPYHPFDEVQNKLRAIFSDAERFDATDDPQSLLDVSRYDAVLSYLDIWGRVLPENAARSLADYLKNGGALLALHNGISLQGDPELLKLIGGRFVSHPAQEALTFRPAGGVHPITRGIEPFTLVEEPYRFAFTGDEIQVLLTYEYRGESYPAGWCREAGKGRVACLCPGHTPEKFDDHMHQKLIRQALDWCINKERTE